MNSPSSRRLGWSLLAAFALVGCDSTPPAPAPPTAPTPTAEPGKGDGKSLPVDKAATDAAEKQAELAAIKAAPLTEDEVAAIKKLPADEQPIAMAQKFCPVGEGHLGEMGMPVKEVVNGQAVFLCCSGCVDKLKQDPATYLAKLKK